jgi:hypothetical protein
MLVPMLMRPDLYTGHLHHPHRFYASGIGSIARRIVVR